MIAPRRGAGQSPFSLRSGAGGGRRGPVRLLHAFDFAGDRIARENPGLDLAGLRRRLAAIE